MKSKRYQDFESSVSLTSDYNSSDETSESEEEPVNDKKRTGKNKNRFLDF